MDHVRQKRKYPATKNRASSNFRLALKTKLFDAFTFKRIADKDFIYCVVMSSPFIMRYNSSIQMDMTKGKVSFHQRPGRHLKSTNCKNSLALHLCFP